MTAYQIEKRAPTLGEYRALCAAVGWEPVINVEAAQASLHNSLYHVIATHGGSVIGMGRIVGDGAMYFYLQDIAVEPRHQRQGVGRLLMDHLMRYVQQHAPARAFVGLFAAPGSERLYEHYGFAAHSGLTGMFSVTPIELPDQP